MDSGFLIGRGAELAVMYAAVDGIRTQGSVLVAIGEAGIGKSSLLRAAAAHARDSGYQVLEVSGVESEVGMPFAGLHQLLRPILPSLDAIPPAQQRALRSAFGLSDGPGDSLFLIALATLSLISEAAVERPVLVILDDLQWLDEPTRDVLAFLARRIGNDPIVIVCARRTGYPDPFGDASLGQLEVSGLDENDARQLLLQHGGDLDAADREAVLEQAAGNPLALVELSAVARNVAHDPALIPLSARLERAFAARIDELPRITRDATLIAAVDTEGETSEILAATEALSGSPVTLDVLEPASAIGLIDFDLVHVRFRHPLMRSALIQCESGARHRAAHSALAAALEKNQYRRTWHRAQSIVGPDEEVADELELSHVESLRRGAVVAAICALERSAQLTTDDSARGRRLLMAAEHAFGLGRADLVDRMIAAASLTPLSALDQARMEWLREIFHDGVPGDDQHILELCRVARASADAGDTDLALNLLIGAALRCWWANPGEVARARVASVTLSLRGAREDPRYVAALAVAQPVLQARTVLGILSEISVETVLDAEALRLLGLAAHAVGDQPLALDFLQRAERKLRDQGRLGLLSHVLGVQGVVRLDLGDWAGSDSATEEARRLAQDTGQMIWSVGPLVNEARSAALQGNSEQALQLAAASEQMPTLRSLNLFLACAQLARGFALITEGRHNEAFEALRRVFDPADPCFHPRERFCGVMFVAEAGVYADRRDEARRIIADMEDLTRVTPSPLLAVQLLYARAVLADDDAESRYREALAADLTRWPWVRARIQFAYGAWLRRQRRRIESREPLRQALGVFRLIGAKAWAENAQTELRAAGDRTATAVPVSLQRLTPQELQIARMAAQGMSNREIGQQLFLSPRTIGSHLYRIFPKLDITSRNQLSARMT
ncbi:AAA family ATPase [Actinoplanes sp. TBRC 11911]|uniref:helix-turn-helix transcriptional regulator n=1 Tax=Actinoplanes sp. TBRC 11911 TaxID=2729386 RepID=UPI00145F3F51|nr:LuxR family transcriptional regulator [Actinoplanes sp. TBRC 11911]NMO55345.1 AAA family ATPase [Actinoplanes sp. TBRC 11911]